MRGHYSARTFGVGRFAWYGTLGAGTLGAGTFGAGMLGGSTPLFVSAPYVSPNL